MIKKVIAEFLVGLRLDLVSAKLFDTYSRNYLTRQINAGKLLVNQQIAKPTYKVKIGDQLSLIIDHEAIHNPWLQAENSKLDILYQDSELLIVNKPADLVTHPGAGVYQGTLLNRLLYHFPELVALPRAGLVHRLDKNTTGCLLVARNITSHTSLVRALQAHEIQRKYWALVHGKVIGGKTISTFINRHPKIRTKMAVTNSGRTAITHFEVVARYQDFSLLKVSLQTGRTHQIRVHLSYEKIPIVGDPLYGKQQAVKAHWPDELKTAFSNVKHQALHAESLTLNHPVTGQIILVQAPLPHDLIFLLQAIHSYGLP